MNWMGLLTPLSDDLSLPLILLEAQIQSGPGFYARFFASIFLYVARCGICASNRKSALFINN